VYDIVRNADPALLTLAQEGSKAYSERYDLLHRREASAPNVMWQADHTLLDIIVLDEQFRRFLLQDYHQSPHSATGQSPAARWSQSGFLPHMPDSLERLDLLLLTKEHRRFEEFCNACRRHRYVGLCYGPPGVGKTLSARHYARWDMMEDRDPLDGNSPVPREIAECRTLFYTAPVTNSPRQVRDDITEGMFLLRALVGKAESKPGELPNYRDCCELVIVDEADRLKMPALEQLRDIYDRGNFGLILTPKDRLRGGAPLQNCHFRHRSFASSVTVFSLSSH
jgi:hypothetical protein